MNPRPFLLCCKCDLKLGFSIQMKAPARMTLGLALLTLSVAFAIPSAVEAQTGIVYGDSHAFFVTAPAGWVLDNRSGLVNGVHAGFYPRGSSWRDSPAVMYANGVGRSSGETLDSFIADDIQASPFDVLVRVAAGGRVEKILSRPKTKISECLVDAMKDDTFPTPPEPDYWWHLHMIIAPKRKTSTPL